MSPLPKSDKAALLQAVFTQPAAHRWALQHPRRFAVLLGWCRDGQLLAEEVAGALNNYGYLSMVTPARGRLPALRRNTHEEAEMPDDEPVNEEIPEEEVEFDVPELLDQILDAGFQFAGPAGAVGRAIPWDKIFAVIEQAIEAKKERDIYKAMVLAWERTGGGKTLLADFLWSETDPEKRARYWAELRPKLVQLEHNLQLARKKLEEGDKDEARRYLEIVRGLLRQLRAWMDAL